MSISVLLGSSRDEGNSEQLAQAVCDGISVNWVRLREKNIRPIVDQRHTESGFQPVNDDYEAVIQSVMTSSMLLFCTPLYWYGMSGLMKNFVDRWSQSLRSSDYDFKAHMQGKPCYVLVSGGPKVHTTGLPLIQQFKHIFDFMSMDMRGYILAHGTKPGEMQNDAQALYQAKLLNQELKSL